MKVSLVVPLRDEEATVISLLESVAEQDRPPDELVVVDAGSSDGTCPLVATHPAPIPTRLVREGPLFPGSARNAGVDVSAHPWVAFTDGGVRLDHAWLSELESGAADGEADVVFGSYDPVCDTFFRRCAAVAYVPAPGGSGVRGPSVASMLLTRDAFERAGRFPPFRAAEDLIFMERLFALPLRIAYAPRAVVHWQLAPDARRTFRRFALYSEHNLRAQRGRYWHLGVLRHYVLMAALTAVVLGAGGGAWALAVYPLWQIARAARSAWHKRAAFDFRATDPRHVMGAAALLSLIDVATLAGAIRWWVRKDSPSV
jgi:glycosyltransferase involved in cell wall biosynthesis